MDRGKRMKKVHITMEFPVEDGEVECFLADTKNLDNHEVLELVEEQKNTIRDWIREATYNRSISYEIRDNDPYNYFQYTSFSTGKFKICDLFRFHKQRKTQSELYFN